MLLLPLLAMAGPIGRAQAMQTAQHVLRQLSPSSQAAVLLEDEAQTKSRDSKSADNAPAYYVFNADGGAGFVIVAGDDQFPTLVGYSRTGSFSSESLPEGLQSFLSGYEQYVADVREGRAEAPLHRVLGDITGEEVVAPLLTCQWGQGSPYNYYVPNQWPVGCVATAMSQIMYFWKYPASGKGKITYSAAGSNITVDFTESRYDWSIMKDKFAAMDWKKEAGKNVAKLCLDCGVSCYMQYNQSGSGAYIVDAYNGLYTNFGYNAETMTLYLRRAMETQEEWNRLLFGELDQRRPVLYAGTSTTGGGSDAAGHAFVIDGYDSNHFVHVNWGWNGDNDGYYDITLLNPGGYTFSAGQEMVIGILPDESGEHATRKQFRMLMVDSLDIFKSSTATLGTNFNLKIGTIYNHGAYAGTYTLGIMLYDQSGQFVQEATVASDKLTLTLNPLYGDTPGMTKCNLPADLSEGYYYLCVESKEKGFDSYVKPFTDGGDKHNQLWIHVHDGKADLKVEAPAGKPGDVNGDGNVDINDVVCIINHMAGTTLYDSADVNGDKEVNINDVVAVINNMAGLTP